MCNFYEGPSSQDNLPLWLPSLMQSQPQWRALVSRSGDSIWRPGTNRGHEVRDRAPTKYYRMKNINNLSALSQMKLIPMLYSILENKIDTNCGAFLNKGFVIAFQSRGYII